MTTIAPAKRGGLSKTMYKLRHFRSGKLYKACRRNWMRLTGRPVVHFLHVRKAGGSAIKAALVPHATSGPCLVECHPHRITVNDIPAGEKFFFAVRDPVARFISGFYSRLNQGAPAHNVPWRDGEEEAFAQFKTPNELGLALVDENPERRAAAERAMKTIIHVRSSYWDWFINEETLRSRADDVLMVLRQENLRDDFAVLVQRLQLPEGVELPRDPGAANRGPDATDRALTPDARRAIETHYRADYALLDLCAELFDLPPTPPCQ